MMHSSYGHCSERGDVGDNGSSASRRYRKREEGFSRPILLHNIHWSSVVEILGLSFSVKASLRGQIVTVTD